MALDGPAWEILAGVVVQATLITSFAYALGWLTRSSAVGIALSYLIFLAVPIVLTAASQTAEWVERLAQYAPDSIIYTVNAAEPSTLGGHWGGPAIMAGYVAVLLIAAALRFRRSDI
jgi:ABC-type transport system involved in multi-copper enzyme maturation permease subunit